MGARCKQMVWAMRSIEPALTTWDKYAKTCVHMHAYRAHADAHVDVHVDALRG